MMSFDWDYTEQDDIRPPEINTAELFAIYKEIATNPDSWYQGDWAVQRRLTPGMYVAKDDVCDTAYCFAGHAVVRNGDTIIWGDDTVATYMCRQPDGRARYISNRARDVLGLTAEQAQSLFRPMNTLEDIRGYIKQFTGVDPADQ